MEAKQRVADLNPTGLALAKQRIADLNATGLALVRFGDYAKAPMILKEAMDCLQTQYPLDFYSNHEMQHDNLHIDVSPALVGPLDAHCHDNAVLTVFDRGFIFRAQDISTIGTSYCVRNYTFIALFFNLALCLHLQAIVTSQNQLHLLRKSLTLYQMGCGLLDQSMDQSTALVMQIALMNNLACVNAHLHDSREAQRWLEDLRFAYWADSGALQEGERAIIRSNLLFNQRYDARPSAAA
jgi:hypothetical protein